MHDTQRRYDEHWLIGFNAPISYVWVTADAAQSKIPSKELSHGVLNVLNTAKKVPSRKVRLYVDNAWQLMDRPYLRSSLEYCLPDGRKMPDNMEIIPVSHLVDECRELATVRGHKVQLINDAYYLYTREMLYGKPAYAGNFIKLLALYKGGFVSDIGVIYNETQFYNVENGLLAAEHDKCYSLSYCLLYSDALEDHCSSVINIIEFARNSYYNPAYKEVIKELIDTYSSDSHTNPLMRPEAAQGVIDSFYALSADSPTAFIKSASFILRNYGVRHYGTPKSSLLQDKAYGFAISKHSYKVGKPAINNHKISHRDGTLNSDMNSLIKSAEKETTKKILHDMERDVKEIDGKIRRISPGKHQKPSTLQAKQAATAEDVGIKGKFIPRPTTLPADMRQHYINKCFERDMLKKSRHGRSY